ncbi:hypothetical protein S83_034827 [Arachis hypogaea]
MGIFVAYDSLICKKMLLSYSLSMLLPSPECSTLVVAGRNGNKSSYSEDWLAIMICLTVLLVLKIKNGYRIMSFLELSSCGRGSKDTLVTTESIKEVQVDPL